MATKANSVKSSLKVIFGRRRKGKAKKSLNKHSSPQSKYKGQGR